MRFLAWLLFGMASLAMASPDEDWDAVLALEKGPSRQPANVDEAKNMAIVHLAAQRRALEEFVTRNPGDPRVVDARIRLASIEATSGKIEDKQSRIDEAMRCFQAIEVDNAVPMEKRAEAGYRRVCLLLQSLDGLEATRRGDFVNAARNFEGRYPRDPRAPRLLVEVATLCDEDPKLKKDLLERAATYPVDASLKARIADDLKRLELLGKPLELRFPLLGGGEFSTTSMRGRVGVLVFWSAGSVPSVLWMRDFRRALAGLPLGKLSIATMALGKDGKTVHEALDTLGITNWPTGFDGKGWESPLARTCGINALPTVFLLDQRGVLRSINARHSYAPLINALLIAPPR